MIDASAPLDIHREDDGTWIVEGPWLRQVMGNVNFADYESRMWFDKVLRIMASSRSWKRWAFRTVTLFPYTILNLNTSGKIQGRAIWPPCSSKNSK